MTDNDNADTASGGAPAEPDRSADGTSPARPTPPEKVNPDDGTDENGVPVDNPAG
ncbi:hypothetical protein QT381_04005 [Galbitalea sp. SE-J8]|uniref:hypothetical protein n=1 Tax=Galbitalea sp. SE-J8 TaxID=3054952 RepID=UPI00259D1B77|nr:hypothetical protein [Galbitalea sp. SE-J8]MDM4762168.1 hypothetical protein [Galbitalea sp. SE-J8]